MAKQVETQRYIYKLHSNELALAKWDLHLPLKEAISHKTDIISMASSQCFRFIDEIRGVNTDAKAREIREQIINEKKKQRPNKQKISQLYYQLYETRFQSDYLCVIMDKNSQYDRANKGFKVNGIKYRRFLGTNGGIKSSTIIYVSEDIYPALKEKLDCGRDKNKPLVPAKLEAYQALMCSGSIPVSMPNGIIVVPDCVTHFKEDIIYIDDTNDGDPTVEFKEDQDFELIDSDGYGFMLPSLSRRWSGELTGYPERTISGVNTRGLPWTKGMLFTFDFIDFAEKVADNYMIKDVWGDWRDVRDAEVILTEGMLKLWDSYESWEDYWTNVEKYGYQFAVSKVAPFELENQRLTNYQFLQSYELDDDAIEELLSPTINDFRDVTGGDWRKTMIYLGGQYVTPKNFKYAEHYMQALLIEPETIKDPYVHQTIYRMIEKRIQKAKIGAIQVKANFAIIGGDPYSLAQNTFGLPVTGLLKKGECYHKYWSDQGVKDVVCFRAPMTSANNIRIMSPVESEEMKYWYRYIDTCMLLNSWDSTCEALNGADHDGDLFFTTNNKVLLNHTKRLPTIRCIQRRAEKKVVTEEDIIVSNKNSFGDAIGSVTNLITAQICLQADFGKGTPEYEELGKRILTGQHLQQCAIDRAKGIIAKPMPKRWHDNHCNQIEDGDDEKTIKQKLFDQKIVVNKKPYFFIYNYDHLRKELRDYERTTDRVCEQRFGIPYDQLKCKQQLSDDEEQFIYWAEKQYPVERSNCLINRICWRIEKEDFDIKKQKYDFDYCIYKSDGEYSIRPNTKMKSTLKDKFLEFQKLITRRHVDSKYRLVSDEIRDISDQFQLECLQVCPDKKLLCDLLLDICYDSKMSKHSKRFVWHICGDVIIDNLLEKHDYKISIPILDNDGDIEFNGNLYSMARLDMKGDMDDRFNDE